MNVYSTGTTAAMADDTDEWTDEPLEVVVVRPKPRAEDAFGSLLVSFIHHWVAAFGLWIVAAVAVPELGIHIGLTLIAVVAYRILTWRQNTAWTWAKAPKKS